MLWRLCMGWCNDFSNMEACQWQGEAVHNLFFQVWSPYNLQQRWSERCTVPAGQTRPPPLAMCGLLRLHLNKAFTFSLLPADTTVERGTVYSTPRARAQLTFSPAIGKVASSNLKPSWETPSAFTTQRLLKQDLYPPDASAELLRWPAVEGCDRTGQLPAVNMSDCMNVKQSVHAQWNTSPEVL